MGTAHLGLGSAKPQDATHTSLSPSVVNAHWKAAASPAVNAHWKSSFAEYSDPRVAAPAATCQPKSGEWSTDVQLRRP